MRCLALIVLATNCISLALLRSRAKPGTVKAFRIRISIFLESPYLLFVLGMRFFLPLIRSDNLTLDEICFNHFAPYSNDVPVCLRLHTLLLPSRLCHE
jgi:hypothetical protein